MLLAHFIWWMDVRIHVYVFYVCARMMYIRMNVHIMHVSAYLCIKVCMSYYLFYLLLFF